MLTAKRELDEFEWKLFRLHFIDGGDWHACCRLLRVDRGTFFHAVYRIESQMGRIFCELFPYPLFPTHDYFQRKFQRKAVPAP